MTLDAAFLYDLVNAILENFDNALQDPTEDPS